MLNNEGARGNTMVFKGLFDTVSAKFCNHFGMDMTMDVKFLTVD